MNLHWASLSKRSVILVGAVALIAALIAFIFAMPHSARSTDEPSADFAVLHSPERPDAKVTSRLPGFVVVETARLAYSDASGSYVAAEPVKSNETVDSRI